MALPRKAYVQDGQEGVYHCFSRCVRRAFLCGFDAATGRDFSHRKAWLLERLRFLAGIFAIDVCAYAIMANHWHAVLRTCPDTVASWSDLEVATRWLTLFPPPHVIKPAPAVPSEEAIRALADRPERIAQLRRRLSSLSWFMGRLNEFIARGANKEDHVKGRFWEARFKCQVLLDLAAITCGMVYVDLNAIRAGIAASPEDSDYTSIQERIRAWQIQTTAKTSTPGNNRVDTQASASAAQPAAPDFTSIAIRDRLPDPSSASNSWLCPISSESSRRGILEITTAQYFDLVDRSGRMMRLDKRGTIHPNLAPLLLRIGANPDSWLETVSSFGSIFHTAAGLLPNLRAFANRLARRWIQGSAAARSAFASSMPDLA
jgi:hypothetical protein